VPDTCRLIELETVGNDSCSIPEEEEEEECSSLPIVFLWYDCYFTNINLAFSVR
jgi:hypothetical protein